MLTKEELMWLYRILDQINVRGEEDKRRVLEIMQKLRKLFEDE